MPEENEATEVAVGAEIATVLDYLIAESNDLGKQIEDLQKRQQTIADMAQTAVNKEATRLALQNGEWQFKLETKSYTRVVKEKDSA